MAWTEDDAGASRPGPSPDRPPEGRSRRGPEFPRHSIAPMETLMRMLDTTSSDLTPAAMAACIDFRGLSEDRVHDILGGYVDVPTIPEPVRLRLTEAEKAHQWHQIAVAEMDVALEGGEQKAIDRAVKAEARTRALAEFEHAVEKIGSLGGGRCIVADEHGLLQRRYRVIDSSGLTVFHVMRADEPETVRRLLEAYDNGIETGQMDARASIRSALGL